MSEQDAKLIRDAKDGDCVAVIPPDFFIGILESTEVRPEGFVDITVRDSELSEGTLR